MGNQQGDKIEGSLQENLLVLLAFSDTSFSLVRNSVPLNLFSSSLFRSVIARVYDFIDQFKKPPRDHLPDLLEDLLANEKQGELVKEILGNVGTLSESINEEYVLSQLAAFIRQQQLRIGLAEAHDALQSGKVEEAEVRLERAMRARLDLFQPGTTLEQVMVSLKSGENQRDVSPTGVPALDMKELGPARKELNTFIAASGRGKSWWLVNLSKQALLQKRWRVVYVTLELAENLVAIRHLMAFFACASRRPKEMTIPELVLDEKGKLQKITIEALVNVLNLSKRANLRHVERSLTLLHCRDNLVIKQFPMRGLTMNGLRAYLDALERQQRFMPDMLIVDYPKLMRIGIENFRLELGTVYEELRGIAVERNVAVVIAAQSNREGAKKGTILDVHAAEDWSLIQTSDVILTYSQTQPERELGLARLFASKGRSESDGISVLISQSYATGQFVLQSTQMREQYWTQIRAAGPEEEKKEAEE